MNKFTKAKNLLKNISNFLLFLLLYTVIIFLTSSLLQSKDVVAFAAHKSIATPWNGDSQLIEGEYYLTQDVHLTQKITIESGHSVTLALNGYAIERTNDIATIEVKEGASLTIQKTKENSISNSSRNTKNTILDNLKGENPFFKVENATCILKEITVDANFLAIKSTVKVSNVKFIQELTLQNCMKVEFEAPKIEDKINIIDGTTIIFSSLSSRKKVTFENNSSILLENATFLLKNTLPQSIVIPNITIAGENSHFEIIKCTIEKFIYQNVNQSTIICTDSAFHNAILFNGNNNNFHFSNVIFGGNVQFTGEHHTFRFENIKSNTNKIAIDSKIIQELDSDSCITFINLEQIIRFIYKANTAYPQIYGLKIEYFVATMATMLIEGKHINAIDYSNLEIQNFVFTTDITATLNENTLLEDKNLYFLPNLSSQDNFCTITVGYTIENKVKLGKGVELNFAENGNMKDVDFIDGATPEEYKQHIDSGKLTYLSPSIPDTVPPIPDTVPPSSDTANKKLNSTKVIIIILSVVIIDMIMIWVMLIFILKGNKKQ